MTSSSFKVHNDPRIPKTSFTCNGKSPGYYADVATGCQTYHMCDDGARQYSYSCPNTTLFHQRMLICAHWYQVNCSHSEHDFSANLLIGQKDKPFVEEDFWKHRFGGAGNTNFPPQEIPIKSVQSNAIHEPFVNTEKSSDQGFNRPAKVPFRTSTKVQNQFFVPQQQQQQNQFVQEKKQIQFGQQNKLQTPQPFSPPTTPDFLQPQSSQNIRTPTVNLEAPEIINRNIFVQKDQTKILKPSIELETPFESEPNQVKSSPKISIELEPPLQDDSQKNIDQNSLFTNKRENNGPTEQAGSEIVLTTALPQLNIGFSNIGQTGDESYDEIIIPSPKPVATSTQKVEAQNNTNLDDRFTQVFILPSGKEPIKGPYEHPDLVKNKVIFTDWNSLYEKNTESSKPISNINEYVHGKLPGEKEEPAEDLQRDFSHFPRPFSFQTTEKIETSPTIQSDIRVPFDLNAQRSQTVQSKYTGKDSKPSIELLPPYGPNDISTYQLPPNPLGPSEMSIPTINRAQIENNVPTFNSFQQTNSASQDNTATRFANPFQISSELLPPLSDDDSNDSVIQNPFQHPFYKVKKMNDNRNIIFIPLKDADFAIELHKVPLNRTRVVRRLRNVRSRHH